MSSPQPNDPLLDVLTIVRRPRSNTLPPSRTAPREDRPSRQVKDDTSQSEQQRFEQRWGALTAKITDQDKKIKDDIVYGYPKSDTLVAGIGAYTKAREKVDQAKAGNDYRAANAALDVVEAGLTSIDHTFQIDNAKAKSTYAGKKAPLQANIDKYGQAIAANKYGNPVHEFFDIAVKLYKQNRQRLDEGERDENYLLASRGLGPLGVAFSKFTEGAGRFDEFWQARKGDGDKISAGISSGAYEGLREPIATFNRVKNTTEQAVTNAKRTEDYAAAFAAITTYEQAVATFRTAAAGALVTQASGTDKKAARNARTKAMAMFKKDPEILKVLAEQPGGPAALDAMVGDMGKKLSTDDDMNFVSGAITARFGPEMKGDFKTKSFLPRLYKVLKMVPASHTKGNPKSFKSINRIRPKLIPDPSSYDEDTKETELIFSPTWAMDAPLVPLLAEKKYGMMPGVNLFDQTTLHEVGHAVDDGKNFMKGKRGAVAFGGWTERDVNEVAAVIGQSKGFWTDFNTLPRDFLQAYLLASLQGKNPASEGTVTGAPGAPARGHASWKALAKHEAVKCCDKIRCRGDNGLWDAGDGDAAKYAIDGEVYQEAYTGKWWSYALSARSQKVSKYQFRSDGEWYAEAYSAFFLKKLPTGHPLYPLLKADQDAEATA